MKIIFFLLTLSLLSLLIYNQTITKNSNLSNNRNPTSNSSFAHLLQSEREKCIKAFGSFIDMTNIHYFQTSKLLHLDKARDTVAEFIRRSKEQEDELYTYTKGMKRIYKNSDPYGVSYDSKYNITTIKTFGDPNFIKSITVKIFSSAKPDKNKLKFTKKMIYNHSERAWIADINDNIEGLWFYYDIESKTDSSWIYRSQHNEPIPEKFQSYNLSNYKVSLHKTSQVWYPPQLSERPPTPVIKGARTLWEINIADIEPPDVDKKYWGTARAIFESKIMKERISHYDGIQILPPRNAKLITKITNKHHNDSLYYNHWGYMGEDFGYSARFGGIEEIIQLIDELHRWKKVIYIDHVFQHTANDFKHFQWLLAKPYYEENLANITGCGNTLDLTHGSITEKLTTSILRRDMKIVGFDGNRNDLWGAVPRDTAENQRNIVLDLGQHNTKKRTSGEGYAYDHENGFWGIEKDVLRRARLHDYLGQIQIKKIVKHGGHGDELKNIISGGAIHSWKNQASDATTIIEVHDGETLAHAMNNDYKKMAHTINIILSAQGDTLFGPGMASAFNHSHVDDTPIKLFGLNKYERNFQRYVFKMLDIRKKFRPFFSEKWLDPEIGRMRFIEGSHSNSLGIHFIKPESSYRKKLGELIILHNLYDQPITFQLPEGNFRTLINTFELKASINKSIYPEAKHSYTVSPHTSVWLWKLPL